VGGCSTTTVTGCSTGCSGSGCFSSTCCVQVEFPPVVQQVGVVVAVVQQVVQPVVPVFLVQPDPSVDQHDVLASQKQVLLLPLPPCCFV